VLIDDMVDTAGTLCQGCGALKDEGAVKVVRLYHPPVLSGEAIERIRARCSTNWSSLIRSRCAIRAPNVQRSAS